MRVRKIQDVDAKGKRILLRVGFDVRVENGHVKEPLKIETVKESVDYLVNKGAKVALLTYLGRPGGKRDLKFSLSQIRDDVEKVLEYKIKFVPDCIGEEVKKAMSELKSDEVLLLENVRFYPGEGSVKDKEDYDDKFAKQLADGFDLFVNDSFSQSHRTQASISGIPKYIPAYAGLLMQKEIENLNKVKDNPEHPAVAIIGGAKIETKVPLIKSFEKNYDTVLVGSKIALEAEKEGLKFSEKVFLPVDYAEGNFDIGEKTTELYKSKILGAKTIVWNGPVGKFEEEPFDQGTKEILKAITESDAFILVGGGESIEVLKKNGYDNKVSFISTGGGAMLEYLSGEKLPGIEALMV